MELVAELSWIDLAIILALAVGVFIGFTQGAVRYLVCCVSVLVAFVIAAQLKGPIVGLLGFWTAFSVGGRELLVFVLLFLGLVAGGWFAARALYRSTRLPVPVQLDELAGAVLGFLWVALLIVFHLVVYDSYFQRGAEPVGWVGGYYDLLNQSLLVDYLRQALIPTAGFLVRPFVPSPIAQLLVP